MRGSRTRSGLKAITDPALHIRVAALFSQAVELTGDEQSVFLQAQCGTDTDLLRLLQNLLQEDQSGVLLGAARSEETSEVQESSDGLSERTLSHYRIVAPMAVGGMGIVYRAMDTRLERTVALKFLPPFLKDNPASRERFLREAQAIASIDHQNVCPVYEIDEAEGLTFIAMAFLEGVTLDRRMKDGPVPLARAIDIALQTARGLQAAHAKGIVHRDIKPANLMLVDTELAKGLVRILDFGIAQWSGRNALTLEGLTAGTVSYMAPEQIEGSRVDARADIWSLGVVLYEMLSGRLPFDRESVREILASIAGPAPADLSPIRNVAPSGVVSVIQKALEKDPAKRYQTASELITELERLSGTARSTSKLPAAGSRKWLRAAGVLALAAATTTAVFFINKGSTPAETEALKIVPFTFYPGYQEHPAISPDNKTIAFVGQGKTGSNPLEVYVQLIGSTDPLRLTTVSTGFADRSPVWDPSATRIAFLRMRSGERFARILSIPALGGPEIDLGVKFVLSTGRLAWSPDGRMLAFTGINERNEGAIFELSLQDHSLRQRSFPAAGQNDCCPQYDPGGKRLAFKRNEVEIVVIGSGRAGVRALPARASWAGLTWTADSRSLVYSWFGKLAEVDLSSGVIRQPAAATLLGPDISDITIRGNRLAYVHWNFEHSIWRLSLRHAATGSRTAASPNVQLIASTMREDTPQFSPDGQSIAFASERSGSTDIWIGNRDGSGLRRLTFLDGHAGTRAGRRTGNGLLSIYAHRPLSPAFGW